MSYIEAARRVLALTTHTPLVKGVEVHPLDGVGEAQKTLYNKREHSAPLMKGN